MLPVNRLLQSQEILISKLAKYLHLVNMQAIAIQDEDIDTLYSQSELGEILIGEIDQLGKTVLGILGDLKKASLYTDDVKLKFERNKTESNDLLQQIEKKNDENRKILAALMGRQKEKIQSVKKSICPDMKLLHSAYFSNTPEMVDTEA